MFSVVLLGLCLMGSITNLDMVESVVNEAMTPIAEQIAGENIEDLSLLIEGEHDGGWLVEQVAISSLSEAGVTVNTTREADGWTLNIRPMELGVSYAQTTRNWFLGGKQIPRIANCEISVTLVDPDGNVTLTSRQGAILENTVSHSNVVLIETGTERWANGEISEEESGNILEPLVVTGVVTALVYLFYSSRN